MTRRGDQGQVIERFIGAEILHLSADHAAREKPELRALAEISQWTRLVKQAKITLE